MQRFRPDEHWVQLCLRRALPGVEVRTHDDGSSPGMHDIDLLRAGRRFAALEITAAVDGVSTELWKLINRGVRPLRDDITGSWLVTLEPTARAKRIHRELPALVAHLERTGIAHLNGGNCPEDLEKTLEKLRIVSAHRSAGDGSPGRIDCTVSIPPERAGGWVPETGDELCRWICAWLNEPDQADNLAKLRRSGADERHLFVVLRAFTTAPFEALDPLVRDHGPLPTVAPRLPEAVTHLWAASSWTSGDMFHWAPTKGWRRFPKTP